jgi:acyl-CoA reductase-like NAD-dependent aldehyde dehydrogenase
MQFDKFYIDGEWIAASNDEIVEIIDPATEVVIATAPMGTPVDAGRAVAAAKKAFPSWSETSREERSEFLLAVAKGLEDRREELADLESHEMGMPRSQSANFQAGPGIRHFQLAGELVRDFSFEDRRAGLVLREPIGVVAAITPWNFPLNQIGAKVAYALAAGCTVILKPSEVAPLGAFVLADIIDKVGVPAGVFNLVLGSGPVVGEALAGHPDVDMVSFTGSTSAGKRVAELAARSVKRVALELGGKSANVILDDAEGFEKAITAGIGHAYANSGQTCNALTRMLVPRDQLPVVEEIASKAESVYRVGNPFDAETRLGPLVSAVQRDRVRSYIQSGIDEGAKLVIGGPEAPDGLDKGYFVRPTIFSNVTPDMKIAQEEIFGPVLVIIPYDTEEEAIEIANGTVYGLAAAVSGSEERAQRVARKLRAGQVQINKARPAQGAPFGGYKQSGIGREYGIFGLEEFLETKALFE